MDNFLKKITKQNHICEMQANFSLGITINSGSVPSRNISGALQMESLGRNLHLLEPLNGSLRKKFHAIGQFLQFYEKLGIFDVI